MFIVSLEPGKASHLEAVLCLHRKHENMRSLENNRTQTERDRGAAARYGYVFNELSLFMFLFGAHGVTSVVEQF